MKVKLLLLLFALFALAAPIFAQGTAGGAAPSSNMWIYISSGFPMAIASGLCGLAQAKAVASACEGMGRNPGAAAAIRFALIFGLVLIESLALYTLVIIIIKVA